MPYKNNEDRKACLRRLHHSKRLKWIADNGPCVLCGSNDRMEVDHVDPSKKISHRVWSWSAERRAKELKKCRVLCYDCHKKKTAQDYKILSPQIHGTWQSYKRTQSPCHCELCRKANADYEAKRRLALTHSKVVSDTSSTLVTSTGGTALEKIGIDPSPADYVPVPRVGV